MKVDLVTLRVFSNYCRAAAESMAFTLYRTAHSTFVKETEDFTTGLTTPDGLTFASPKDLGATWFVALDYGNVIKLIDEYHEGDICLTNDPYSGYVCSHTPDMHLWKPIFHQGELICFAVGHIHNTDMGGAVPASLSRSLTEVHQEGIRIPPTKLFRQGVLNEDLVPILSSNVRMPTQNWGDLMAQVAAMNTGERKVIQIVERLGIETFRSGIGQLLDHADQQARAIIRKIPDGEYFFSDYMDEDSVDGQPCRLALNLKVNGDQLEFDFSGSDPQVQSSLNLPTGGHERHALLMIGLIYVFYSLDRSIFLNAGLLRPCRAILPQGSIVNPETPSAVGMRSLTCVRLMGVIIGALGQALPDKLPAAPASGGPIVNVKIVDNRNGRAVMASVGPVTGGAGGNPREDGTEGSGANNGFLKNAPIEISETETPVKFLRYGLLPDSGGAGLHRGGLSTIMEFQVYAPFSTITARNRDRSRFQCWGAQGGKAGKPSVFILNPDTPRAIDLGNTDVVKMQPGDILRVSAAGAGGWGDPSARDPLAVLEDVKSGFITPRTAQDEYGVIISHLGIDVEATARTRALIRNDVARRPFDFGAGRDAFEMIWDREAYASLTELLARLPIHWRFFIKHEIFRAVADTPSARKDVIAAAFAKICQVHAPLRRALAAGSNE